MKMLGRIMLETMRMGLHKSQHTESNTDEFVIICTLICHHVQIDISVIILMELNVLVAGESNASRVSNFIHCEEGVKRFADLGDFVARGCFLIYS